MGYIVSNDLTGSQGQVNKWDQLERRIGPIIERNSELGIWGLWF